VGKAARGEDGCIYPWGNEFDPAKANTAELKRGRTSDVGKFSPLGDSPYGCADMAGNVWEWCGDWFMEDGYRQRENSVVKDPQGPAAGRYRALRGGSFFNNHGLARCTYRRRDVPDHFNDIYGFRVVSSPMPSV
jgi:formylglycine-generating enzyme required for sulfatase activity